MLVRQRIQRYTTQPTSLCRPVVVLRAYEILRLEPLPSYRTPLIYVSRSKMPPLDQGPHPLYVVSASSTSGAGLALIYECLRLNCHARDASRLD